MQLDGQVLKEGDLIFKGATIDLSIGNGKGSEKESVPDIIGWPLDEAIELIRAFDFNVGIVEVVSDTLGQEVFVVRQNPVANSSGRIGDLIDLWVVPESDSLYQQLLISDPNEI